MSRVLSSIQWMIDQYQLAPMLQGEGLFVNAHEGLDIAKDAVCVQHFKPYAFENSVQGIQSGSYDWGLVLGAQQIDMLKGEIAQTLENIRPGGLLMVAADNKAGGARLPKFFHEIGLTSTYDTKQRVRVCWAQKSNVNEDILKVWIEGAQRRDDPPTGFVTKPGIFGWQKIDRGSALLIEAIDMPLKGRGADFGAGYGFLSSELLKNGTHEISHMDVIDADHHALDCARENLNAQDCAFLWEDLTKPYKASAPYDFIVMNPPFHDAKQGDPAIGQAFIQNAYSNLKPGGQLWMVANTHLPYETTLSIFPQVERKVQKDGFKVLYARR